MTALNPTYFVQADSKSPSHHNDEIGEACIPNISPQERKKRVRFAIGQLGVTLLVLVVIVALNINPLWRLLLFFLFSAATTSYIQALDKT